MRRMGTLLAVVMALWAIPAAGAGPDRVAYQATYTGLVFQTYNDTGYQPNGGDCKLSPHDSAAPFKHSFSVTFAWTAVFRFAFDPKGTRAGIAYAKVNRLSGSHFSYQGYDYSDSCRKVSYGPGGKPCTGSLRTKARGYLVLRTSRERTNEDLRLTISPVGELAATPASCSDTDDPPTQKDAVGTLHLLDLIEQLTAHAYALRERLAHQVDVTKSFKIDWRRNCSQAADSTPDIKDQCADDVTGNAFLKVEPIS